MDDYWDDIFPLLGTGTLPDEAREAMLHAIADDFAARHPFTKGGAYRNREGHLVTWDSTEDGSYQVMQTWPGE